MLEVVYATYNMGTGDFPDIYACALGPATHELGHIYQANPSCPCYDYYIYMHVCVRACVCMCSTCFDCGIVKPLLKHFYHFYGRY